MPKNYYKSFIKENLIVICGVALVYLKGIILMPIIIKSVGVTIYGGFILLTSVLGIALGLSSFGAGFRTKRFMPSAKTMTERVELFYPQFYFNLIIILILSLLFIIMKKTLNTYLFKDEVVFSIWIIPLYLVFYQLYSQSTDYFRYTSRIHYMTLATLCFPYLHIVFIILYLNKFSSISIDMLIISMSFSALLIAIPSFYIIFHEIGAQISFYKSGDLVSDIKLGFPLVLGFIIDFILSGLDRYFIAFYLSVTDVGYYVPGYVLGSLIIFIPKAMGTALPQLLSRAVDSAKESEAHTMLNYAIKLFLLLAIPFIFGCLVLTKPILTILANQEVATKAIWVSPIVALGTLFYGLNNILSNLLFVRLNTKALFKMNLVAALFSLLANFVFIYFFRNIIVAAIVSFLSYLITFVYVYKIVIRERAVSFSQGTITKSIAASAVMYGVLYLTGQYVEIKSLAVRIVLLMSLGMIVYTLLLFLQNTFSRRELAYLKQLFNSEVQPS